MPTDKGSPLLRPLQAVAAWVIAQPRTVLGAGLALAAVSIGLAVARLEFKSSRLDLLNPASEYNQRWLAYLDEFGRVDDAVIVIRGEATADVTAAMDSVVGALSRSPNLYRDPLCRIDHDRLQRKGLYFLTADELMQTDRFVAQLEPVLFGRWETVSAPFLLREFNEALQRPIRFPSKDRDQAGELINHGQRLVGSLQAALRREPRFLTVWPSRSGPAEFSGADYFLADEGQLGFVLVRLPSTSQGLAGGNAPTVELRRELRKLAAQHSRVRIGLTGLPILEHDEMQASQRDTIRASLLSLLGVSILFSVGFGAIHRPLMAVAALLLALAWCMGFITLSVGHLNILSVAFGAILVGLGIDFGIHFIARYQQVRGRCESNEAGVRETVNSVGPGIVTGGVTTAVAFMMAAFSEFTGVAELGWIAGGGVLLCVASALIILPALLMVRQSDSQPESALGPPLPLAGWTWAACAAPRIVLGLACLCLLALGLGLPELKYDHNLLNLQPRELEAVRWEKLLLEKTDRSVWFALSMCDSLEELKRRKAAFRSLPSVDRTEEIASLLPTAELGQRQLVEKIHLRLRDLPHSAPVIPLANGNPESAIQHELTVALNNLPAGSQSLRHAIGQLKASIDRLPAPFVRRRLYEHQQQLATDALKRLWQIRDHSEFEPPSVQDLEAPLVDRFVGRTQKHLLKVYAEGDIWDIESLGAFVRDLEQVDPRITGHPVQTFYASSQMQRSYVDAAGYALLAVVVILMIDFRSPTRTLLAMLPMALGLLGLFGALGWLGVPLNAANMIVLPLIVGIGIDDGVHVVHDWQRGAGPYRLGNSTASAIVLTSATTMIGFGSLMFAQHQGLRSLGQVLTLGVLACLLASLLVLPAILSLLSRASQPS